MHRYSVKYIARDGYPDSVTVLAKSKGEARRNAEERGCEDILKVRRIGFPVATIVVVVLALAGILYFTMR